MNWDVIEGKWKQAAGEIKAKWAKLTDDDLKLVGGKRDQLLGRIQERYGWAKDRAEQELSTFEQQYGRDTEAMKEKQSR